MKRRRDDALVRIVVAPHKKEGHPNVSAPRHNGIAAYSARSTYIKLAHNFFRKRPSDGAAERLQLSPCLLGGSRFIKRAAIPSPDVAIPRP